MSENLDVVWRKESEGMNVCHSSFNLHSNKENRENLVYIFPLTNLFISLSSEIERYNLWEESMVAAGILEETQKNFWDDL